MPRYRNVPVDVVIDVRSRLEFWLGHLPGAVCIPVTSIADAIGTRQGVTRDSRIMVYCASGNRSAQAAAVLRQLGYKRVTDAGAIATARGDYAKD